MEGSLLPSCAASSCGWQSELCCCNKLCLSGPYNRTDVSVRDTILKSISNCKISPEVTVSTGNRTSFNQVPGAVKGWPKRNLRVVALDHLGL